MRDRADESPVRVRLTPAQVGRLRRDWSYGRARVESEPGGTTPMTYGDDDVDAALSLVRWLGSSADLVAPAAWREALRRDLAAMLGGHHEPALRDTGTGGDGSGGGNRRPDLPAHPYHPET